MAPLSWDGWTPTTYWQVSRLGLDCLWCALELPVRSLRCPHADSLSAPAMAALHFSHPPLAPLPDFPDAATNAATGIYVRTTFLYTWTNWPLGTSNRLLGADQKEFGNFDHFLKVLISTQSTTKLLLDIELYWVLSSTPCCLSLNLILVKYFHSRGHRLMEKQTRQVDRVISEGRGIEGSKILQYRRYRNMHMCSSRMAHLSLLPPVTLTALHHYWETRTDNEYNNMDPTPSLPITIALHVGAQIHPLNVIFVHWTNFCKAGPIITWVQHTRCWVGMIPAQLLNQTEMNSFQREKKLFHLLAQSNLQVPDFQQ